MNFVFFLKRKFTEKINLKPKVLMKLFMKFSLLLALFIFALSISSCGVTAVVSAPAPPVTVIQRQTVVEYVAPEWAPPVYRGARYYYMPDIETYYDLQNRDFVYLDNGQWLFSNTLPNAYAGYDLNNGFAVTLNANVYQPWFHHQYYISNYPRYYYRNVYASADYRYVRGFNENESKPVFYRDEESARIDAARERERHNNEERERNRQVYDVHRNDRPTEQQHAQEVNKNRNDNNSRANTTIIINNTSSNTNGSSSNNSSSNNANNATNAKANNANRVNNTNVAPPQQHNDRPTNAPNYSRPPQATNYYGRNIGQPVKVTPNMRVTKPAPQTVPIKAMKDERMRGNEKN